MFNYNSKKFFINKLNFKNLLTPQTYDNRKVWCSIIIKCFCYPFGDNTNRNFVFGVRATIKKNIRK